MANILPAVLTFEQSDLCIIDHKGRPWIAAADLARALGYKRADQVTRLYERNFSPRGCHLIAMLAHTQLAASFRRWILDVLETYEPTPALPAPEAQTASRSPAQDGLFEFQFKGKRFRILFASGQLMYSSEDAMQILGRAGEPSESAFIRKMAKQQDAWHALIPNTQQHLPVFSELAFMELLNTASHQTANDLLVWLNDEVRPVLYTGQTAGLSQQPNPEQALRAVLEGKRFICAFDHEQRLTLRELTQEERILTPEKLPQWIADPFGAPFSCLPEVLRAATERLISGRRRPGER